MFLLGPDRRSMTGQTLWMNGGAYKPQGMWGGEWPRMSAAPQREEQGRERYAGPRGLLRSQRIQSRLPALGRPIAGRLSPPTRGSKCVGRISVSVIRRRTAGWRITLSAFALRATA